MTSLDVALFVVVGITETAIVEKGRNIVSASRDKTARLWDVGQSVCLDTVAKCDCIINCCALEAPDNAIDLGTPDKPPSMYKKCS